MNIFYISHDPEEAARDMVDRHIVKMPLESAQLLSTAHRVLDGTPTEKIVNSRKRKQYILTYPLDNKLYQATHINHPSAVWVRQRSGNYIWLFDHFVALLDEYTYRYGKVHKCSQLIPYLKNIPDNIPDGVFTRPTPAMADEYIISENSLDNYRNYYKLGKTHLHSWKNREPPDWIKT